jgi:hypothetical protein
MSTEIVAERCIAEAEKRIDAIEVLCDIIRGQVRAERRELWAIRSAIASPAPSQSAIGQGAPGEISANMLG